MGLKVIRDKLLKKKSASGWNANCFQTNNPIVQAASFEVVASKKDAIEKDEYRPIVVLDLDVKGIKYDELKDDPDLKSSFVVALRSAIASADVGLETSSIVLDITNGNVLGGVPYVHVTARFPAPTNINADATMSKWPGGSQKIGADAQSNIRAIANIDKTTKDGNSGHHDITKYFQNKFTSATTHFSPSNFDVMVGPTSAKNAADTVNMDFVIHGIDYQDVVPARRSAFVLHLAEAVRNGFDWSTVTPVPLPGFPRPPTLDPDTRKNIHVTISNHGDSDNAVNVRAKIDAPVLPADLQSLMTNIEDASKG